MVRGIAKMSELIGNPGKIWLAVEPVDMRRGIDGLSMVVQQSLQRAPCAGSVFIFCNRAGNRVKVLLWDGTGVWLCQRRLHQGRFVWPKSDKPCFTVTPAQWEWLIAGVDWQRLSASPPAHLQA
jgi:transposase